MKNQFIYKIICSIMILSIICACSSDNVLTPEEFDVPARSNDQVAGPCCPYHLTGPCPSDCFSSGGYHPCLNPDHMNMQKQTEAGIICEGCHNDIGGGGGSGDPQPKYCDACKLCLACAHIRKYMDENGNSNGYMPSQPYIHTCNTLTGGCIQCICCKSNTLQ